MATMQKMRPGSSRRKKAAAALERSENQRKVGAWLHDDDDPFWDVIMDHKPDTFRGRKRKASAQEQEREILSVDSDGEVTVTFESVTDGHSSKKHKRTPNTAPPFRRRVASAGHNRNEDVPDSDPVLPVKKYIIIEDSSEDERLPPTPTPAQRALPRVNGSGRVRRQTGGGEQTRSNSQAFSRRQGTSSRTSSQGIQLNGQGHNPIRPGEWLLQQPFNPDDQTQTLPIRSLQQQQVEQVIEQVVHQPEFVDLQNEEGGFQQFMHRAAQDYLHKAHNPSSPPALGQLAVSPRTEDQFESAVQNQVAARPKAKPTPRKKGKQTCSTLPADYFFTMPREVRENIFRHLLISTKPIQVSKIWTDVARAITRRTGRGRAAAREEEEETTTTIDARILSVCRQAHEEGSRILYSENTFFYKLRDGDSVPSYALTTSSPTSRQHRDTGSRGQDWHTRWLDSTKPSNKPGPINFKRYGPLLRRLRVELEPNRSTDEKYENLLICALEALVSRPGQQISLHVLSLAISPAFSDTDGPRYLSTAPFFAPGHRVMKALKQITTNYLHLDVHVDLAGTIGRPAVDPTAPIQPQPMDLDDSDDDDDVATTRHLETTIDMRFTPRHMRVVPPSDAVGADLWARDALMLEKRAARGRRAELCLSQLRRRIEGACVDPDEAIRRNWFDDTDDAEFLRMSSVTGWVGTSEVEDADEFEDRELFLSFGRDAAGRMVVVRT